ncbi:putative WD repeat-containing protein [Porphyridium purpureum]|uniref:Putative WD repeat-containing protein n=1 Tax=Porphyridium purpureum TaxID=35688 RepID=A0A5J4YNC5_PORPP|nr:putative WD repeat-containing protein [Porphyridium purpureum]|eukprot:POR3986..scf222_8
MDDGWLMGSTEGREAPERPRAWHAWNLHEDNLVVSGGGPSEMRSGEQGRALGFGRDGGCVVVAPGLWPAVRAQSVPLMRSRAGWSGWARSAGDVNLLLGSLLAHATKPEHAAHADTQTWSADELLLWQFMAATQQRWIFMGVVQSMSERSSDPAAFRALLLSLLENPLDTFSAHPCRVRYHRARCFRVILQQSKTDSSVNFDAKSSQQMPSVSKQQSLSSSPGESPMQHPPTFFSGGTSGADCCSGNAARPACQELAEAYQKVLHDIVERRLGSWQQIFEAVSAFPMCDRLFVYLHILPLDNDALCRVLFAEVQRCRTRCDFFVFALVGFSDLDVIRTLAVSRIRHMGDVQGAALITLYAVQFAIRVGRSVSDTDWLMPECFGPYASLLDRWGLFTERALFLKAAHGALREMATRSSQANAASMSRDISLQRMSSKITNPLTWTRSVDAVCYYCNRSLRFTSSGPKPSSYKSSNTPNKALPVGVRVGDMSHLQSSGQAQGGFGKLRVSCCTNCGKQLPRCVVCRVCVDMANPTVERALQKSRSSTECTTPDPPAAVSALTATQQGASRMAPPNASPRVVQATVFVPPTATSRADWMSFCTRCQHGGHAAHLQSWYADHQQCASTGCDCICTEFQ